MRVGFLIGLTFAALTMVPASAIALPQFSATTTDGGSETNSTGASSSGLVSGPLSPPGSSFTRQESALANSGGLRASARVTANVLRPADGNQFNHSASAMATLRFDDFMIVGPDDTTSGSINLTLDGTFGTGTLNLTNLFTAVLTSSIGFSITGSVDGQPFNGSFTQTHSLSSGLFAPPDCNPCETTSAGANGIIGQGPLPLNIVTPTFNNLPVNTPFVFELALTASASATYQFGGSSCNDSGCSSAFNIDSLSDFSQTLSFPSSGPIINFVTDGFTLNSNQAGIINNQLAAVPEPPTLLLVGSALAGLAGYARRRRHRSV